MSTTDIHRDILKLAIIQLVKSHHFDSIEKSALEVLTDVLEDCMIYIFFIIILLLIYIISVFISLSYYSNSNANLTGRTESNFHDIMVAIQNLNIRFSELKQYCLEFKEKSLNTGYYYLYLFFISFLT